MGADPRTRTGPSPAARWRSERVARLLAVGAVLFLAVTAIGGYGMQWQWTGFQENDTFWDWLNLVLLPVTIAFVPLWLSSRARHPEIWHSILALLAGAFIVLIYGGYVLHWSWTGFKGNTLWDWLKLCLVPFVLPGVLAWVTSAPTPADESPSPADPAASRRQQAP
jgi:uncharacterized membrane protein